MTFDWTMNARTRSRQRTPQQAVFTSFGAMLRWREERSDRRPWRLVAALAAVLATSSAFACSPIKVVGVYFDRESAVVSAQEVSRLANWMAELRVRYPNHEAIFMGASAEPGERKPEALARARALNVEHVLKVHLAVQHAAIYLPERYHVMVPALAYLKMMARSQGVRGVQLDFLPACPHECPCQRGDPLYQPPVEK